MSILLSFAITLCASLAPQGTEILIADFEASDYGAWKTTGDAFGHGPAQGTLPGQMHVDGYLGKGLVNSFHKGDGTTGTLTSPPFEIKRKYLNFLIGGGKDPEKLALNLRVDGRVVRRATGPNDRPGGTERLEPAGWDVSAFLGKTATLEIIDQATGSWGHINVDHIVQSDHSPPADLTDAQRSFAVEKRYLNLPIKNGAKKRVVTLLAGGKVVVRNDVELADGIPDWWAPMDVSAFKGKEVTLRVDKLREDSQALTQITAGDTFPGEDQLYREPLRGQFHFSPRRGWNNDPNGLVYFKGEYHLFFQHNPYGWGWGNMHWGHAVSKDLVHWEELGDVLMPDDLGPMFSGSAVVDTANTSGFGKPGETPLVLIYTAAGNPTTQCIAYSLDGRHFTKYEKNPVVKQITPGNRDPKVIWHAPTKRWVMVLYVGLEREKHTIHFFTSPNLRDWTLASVTPGGTGNDKFLFECPDFFELAVDGDASRKKWILMAANSQYVIGQFDGTRFTPESGPLPGQHGVGFYAPQTFSDLPAADGRRIQIGWLQTETKGMPFNQSMSIPMEFKLVTTPEGLRLTRTPVRELAALRAKTQRKDLNDREAELAEIQVEFELDNKALLTLHLRGGTVSYDAGKQELVVNGHRAPAPLRDGKQRLTIFCDRTALEVFASDGLTYVPMPFQPDPKDRSFRTEVKQGGVKTNILRFYELKSAW